MARAKLRRATILAVATALGGCQLLAPSDELQCSTSADCEGRGGAFAGSQCVDELCLPPGDACIGRTPFIAEDQLVPLHVRIPFLDVAERPLAGIEVLVCAPRDEPCNTPVGPPVITDAQGNAYVSIWKNFRGTLQVKNPPSDFMKVKLHLLIPLVDQSAAFGDMRGDGAHMISKALIKSLLSARAPLDPRAGHILGAAVDCTIAVRAGVSVSLITDAPGQPLPFYFSPNRIPSFDATETSFEGSFGFANVPPGPVRIEGTIKSTGKRFASIDIWVNEDTLSQFTLLPTYLPP